LLEQPASDFVVAARQSGISLTAFETDLRKEVERLPAGSGRTPVFSRHLPVLFEHAWLIASLGPAGRRARSSASAAATCCWRC
jgi:type VI secretion system protein VasG